MLWRCKNLRRRARFLDLAVLHHDHLIGDFADHIQIVSDEQHRHAALPLQLGNEVEDLALDRHIKRRGRFISN